MGAMCCWSWCHKPRTLSATELLVAASFNTAVRRISRGNSDDSLDDFNYASFVVPPPSSPCPSRSSCRPLQMPDYGTCPKEDANNMEMLVVPLHRHQEQLKSGHRGNDMETYKRSNKQNHTGYRSSSDDCDSPSGRYSDCEDHDYPSSGVTDNLMTLVDYEEEYDASLMTDGKTAADSMDECFGSVIVSTRQLSAKAVGVLVSQLQGVPWLGGNEGLSVEVRALGTAKSQWVLLPNAKGPEVVVQREVNLKLPRPKSSEELLGSFHHSVYPPVEEQVPTDSVIVTLWAGCAGHPRYSAIGHAIVPTRGRENSSVARIMGLYGHTKLHGELGSLEVSLTSSSISSSNTTPHRGLLLKILRSEGLQKPSAGWLTKQATKTLSDKDRLDVWCSVTLWVGGERIKKQVTPKVVLPMACDPSFKASCTFFVPKQEQHKACLVVKVHCGRTIHEVTIGRLVLGPLLYLGSYRHPPLLPLDTSTPRPVTLSHWGRSLNTHFPITAWHRLRH